MLGLKEVVRTPDRHNPPHPVQDQDHVHVPLHALEVISPLIVPLITPILELAFQLLADLLIPYSADQLSRNKLLIIQIRINLALIHAPLTLLITTYRFLLMLLMKLKSNSWILLIICDLLMNELKL